MIRIATFSVLLLVSSFAALSVLAAEQPKAAAATLPPAKQLPPLPNIILIVADDLGYGEIGCYGQTRIKTPNLDRLAEEGIRFTNFYAGSTVCAPSRCALMTGLHTGHAWIRGNKTVPLRPEDITMAEVLKGGGYKNAFIGKWGLGNADTTGVPQKQGFDEVVGYLDQVHAHNYYPQYLFRVDPRAKFDGGMTFPENERGKKGLYSQDLFTTAALNFIRIDKPDRLNSFRPFFAYLAYTIPHANNEEGARTGNGMEVPSDEPYSSEPWPQPEKNKAAMITRMDNDIGKLIEQLKRFKLDDNTLIIFTSDNGPHKEGGCDPKFFQSAGPFRGYKRDLYEGGIRVPMIARWPAVIPMGRVSDHVSANWDLLPTLAEIARVKAPAGDGISMLPALMGQTQTNQHDFLYWEFHENGSKQAVRMGDWKAIRLEPGKPLELYNLKKDSAEKHDVATEHLDVIAKIESYLKTARTDNPEWPLLAKPAAKETEKTPSSTKDSP